MPFNSQTTAFPGGLTNARVDQTMAKAGTQDPTWSQIHSSEFNTMGTNDYTLSGTGVPAFALTGAFGPGGVAALSTTAGAADSAVIIMPQPSFQLTPNKHQFYKARLQVQANSASAAVVIGLAASTALQDGLYFVKASGQSNWILRSSVGGVNTDIPLPAACAMADATWLELGFHCDPQGNIEAFFNPTTGNNAQQASVNGRGRVASILAPNLTQQLLGMFASMTNASAVARTAAIDFMMTSSER